MLSGDQWEGASGSVEELAARMDAWSVCMMDGDSAVTTVAWKAASMAGKMAYLWEPNGAESTAAMWGNFVAGMLDGTSAGLKAVPSVTSGADTMDQRREA